MTIKILLADDHAILRQGLKRSFESEEGFEVIGEAANGHETVQKVRELSPDIVVMDISMPDLNGIEATRQIRRDFPDTRIIGLSMHSSSRYVREMFRAGAKGYLLKDCPLEELTGAIRTVATGKTFISPSISHMLIDDYANGSKEEKTAFQTLSQREREVLQLIAEGNTTKQIGLKLHISPKTVEAHRRNIIQKVEIDNIAELTKYAIQEGLTETDL
ncbi:MAG: response regulator transcription factor [Sedimentisphaerales bacterium]|nr:response regulator transcription factor [Sedimentisphaerales bacterium]